MGVLHSPESAFAREMASHNAHHSEYGAPGRPYEYRPFPTRMYRAWRNPNGGKIEIKDAETAEDDTMRRNLESRGFVWGGQQAAVEAWEQREREEATAAAERNYDVAHGKHSERAQQEIAAAESAAGAKHLGEVPETPIRPRPRTSTN